MAIQVRRGNELDFDPSKMLPGEWAVSLDTRYVRMCFSPGICLRMATYEAFEADMAEIQSIVAEARTIEEAVARIQAEINDTAIVVEDYAILSKSYAVGGTGTRENEDVDNAKYYYEQAKHISQGGNGLVPLGTIAFENLPTEDILTNAMYNISNDFTSDERFLDGGGILYGKGSNVFYTADGKLDVLAASDVKGVKGEAEDTFRQGNVNITKGNIGLENVDNTSDADKPISNEQQAEFDRIDSLLGNTDISDIADGTLTGAIREVADNPADASVWLSQAEYDALSDEEKDSDTQYFIYDAGEMDNAYTVPFRSDKYVSENVGDALNEVNENLAKVNENSEWKELGTLTKNNSTLLLPENFNEVYVYATGISGVASQIFIPRVSLTSTNKSYTSGYYAVPQTNFACGVSCQLSNIHYGWVYQDGVEKEGTMSVYYR